MNSLVGHLLVDLRPAKRLVARHRLEVKAILLNTWKA